MNDWINGGCYYAFAAKGIQNYIMRSDRLKEMIGASELIEQLPHKMLTDTLAAFNLIEDRDYAILSQVAGSARLIFKDDTSAKNFARLWPLLIEQFAPGLEMTQAWCAVKGDLGEAMEKAENELRTTRNRVYATLPTASPLVRRNPRNGKPAVGLRKNRRDKEEPVDYETQRKWDTAPEANSALLKRIVGGELANARKWAFEFEDIVGENSYMAVIHADANGLGGVAQKVRAKVGTGDAQETGLFRRFSEAVEKANIAAVGEALNAVIGTLRKETGRYPLRPIVCAGDDLTLVIRADLAMSFVQTYLGVFETESAKSLAPLIEGVTGLTACAGVAFVKKGYPYWRAYELAESLCKHAKSGVKRQASAVSFWRVTTSLGTDFDQVIGDELTTRDNCVLTMAPYVVGCKTPAGMPTLSNLLALLNVIRNETPRGSLRHVISNAYINKELANRAFERARDVASEKPRRELDEKLERLTGRSGKEALWAQTRPGENHERTPLLDAIELKAVGAKSEEDAE